MFTLRYLTLHEALPRKRNFGANLDEYVFDNVSSFSSVNDEVSGISEINYLQDKNHVHGYEKSIRERPTYSCSNCDRFLFLDQIHRIDEQVVRELSFEEKRNNVVCQTCCSFMKKKEIPYLSTKANNLEIPDIPSELSALSMVEKRLIALIQIFMTIIILPGGQMAEKGLVLNLPTNVQIIANQLPLNVDDTCIVTVNYEHNSYVESENFRYKASPSKVKKALLWLKKYNVLYNDITIDNEKFLNFSNEQEYSLDSIEMESATVTPLNSTVPINCSAFGNQAQDINVPHIEEKPVYVFQLDHGEEMAFPWLFPHGVNGLNHERPKKITKSMYFKHRLYNQKGIFRKDLTYLLHSAVAFDLSLLKSEINIQMRMRKGRNNDELISARDVKNFEHNDELKENSYMFMKNIRGTVAYFRNQLYNLLAMFRCLGPPTLFITLSADDLHWPELGMLLHDLDFDEAKQKKNFCDGMRSDPLMTAIHFERRFKSLMKQVILGEHNPLGKVVDYFARVEFQNRGSPHIHMFLWVESVPTEITRETIPKFTEYINKTICSVIPDCNDDPELNHLVSALQSHSHTPYCTKSFKSCCRFGFPKPVCERTTVFGNINFSSRNKGKFYNTRRRKEDVMINSYNPMILRHWRANMDIQIICNAEGAAYYVCSYICKSEPDELKNALGQLIHDVFKNSSITRHERLRKIGLTVLRHRRLSAQEAAFRLSNLNLIHVTRTFVYLNTRQPSKRFKILKSKQEIDDLDDSSTDVFHTNIIDYYHYRPQELNGMCLFRFSSWYKKSYTTPTKKPVLTRIYINKYDIIMQRCKKPMIVRFPRFSPSSDDYFYSMLLLLLPHRSEDELILPYTNPREAFIQKRHMLDTDSHFMYFSFVELIENTIRKLNLVSQMQENSTANDELSETISSLNNEAVLESLFHSTSESNEYDEKSIAEDFHDDVHMHSFTCSMSVTEFQENVKKLTPSQLKALYFVKSKYEHKELPFHLFLTGGAGVGKTFTTKVIIAYLQLFCAKVLNSNTVVVCAPTGTAASNINGRTIHSLFRIPVAEYLNYAGLSSYTLKQVRKEFLNVHTVVIDEISMVSSDMLSFISRRLSEIKNNDCVFGGCNVIAVGDFFQLRPVKGRFVFRNELLWQLFYPVFLKENNRQSSDSSYYELLNRIRVGYPNEEDIAFLKTKLIYDESKFSEYLHLYPTRKEVEMFNNKQLNKLSNFLKINADHYYSSEDNHPLGHVAEDHIPSNDSSAGGLKNVLMVSIGARVMLIRNINTASGLVNGAIGTIVNITFANENGMPSCINVKFDDPKVGQLVTKEQSTVHSPISIEPYEHRFVFKGRHVVRVQFPLILSWACTIHKVQGISLNTVVLDLGSSVFEYGMAYVALSRVTSSSGLILMKLDPTKIKASDPVLEEYERLREIVRK